MFNLSSMGVCGLWVVRRRQARESKDDDNEVVEMLSCDSVCVCVTLLDASVCV